MKKNTATMILTPIVMYTTSILLVTSFFDFGYKNKFLFEKFYDNYHIPNIIILLIYNFFVIKFVRIVTKITIEIELSGINIAATTGVNIPFNAKYIPTIL